MRKTFYLLAGLVFCLPATMLVSCVDGYDDEPLFESDVRNTQLSSPSLDKSCFATISTSSGEKVQMTWPLVHGAGGYLVNVAIQSGDTQTPVITDSVVDGVSVTFDKYEDTKYVTSVRTLGNEKYNNTDATDATSFVFSTMVEGVSIPAGADVAQFINSYIAQHKAEMDEAMAADPNNYEMAFEMEAGQKYTLNEPVDFGLYPITFRSADKVNRATLTLGENGYITTQAGLKVKFINFDCTMMPKAMGLITLGATPDASISTEALGYKALGANQDGFVIQKPVVLQECWVKNLPATLIYGNAKPWSISDLRIKDCIIQAANAANTTPWINLTGSTNGLIQKLTMENTTFLNTEKNEKEQYFLRYSNSSNAQPRKIYGNTNNFLEYTISNCSFLKTNPKKDFANNMPNTQNGKLLWIKVENTVFYDVYRLYQLIQSQWVKTTTNNFMSYSADCSPQTTDFGPGGRTDQYGNFYTTRDEAVEFNDADLKPLDFSKPNAGLSLAPAGLAAAAKAGDPRWY